jgi:uncharacterized UPF0160 family protein
MELLSTDLLNAEFTDFSSALHSYEVNLRYIKAHRQYQLTLEKIANFLSRLRNADKRVEREARKHLLYIHMADAENWRLMSGRNELSEFQISLNEEYKQIVAEEEAEKEAEQNKPEGDEQ